MIDRINSLMRLFTELTGNPVVSSYMTQGEAREWLNAGFTEDDLRTMVKYRRATVSTKDSHILKAMLRWRFIIGDVQRFAEDLPEAKAYFKAKAKPSAREQVLQATGRIEVKPREPKTAAQVLDRLTPAGLSEEGKRAFEQFRAFRQTLERL